jgi:hypothetical protein
MRHCLAPPQTHGTEVNRGGGWLIPNKNSKVEAQTYENNQEMSEMTIPHRKNSSIRQIARQVHERHQDLRVLAACLLANLFNAA